MKQLFHGLDMCVPHAGFQCVPGRWARGEYWDDGRKHSKKANAGDTLFRHPRPYNTTHAVALLRTAVPTSAKKLTRNSKVK